MGLHGTARSVDYAAGGPRFVRRTTLAPGEYRKNFHQIDRDVLAVITSAEADRVTPLMSKVYLRLVNAPERFWEREGVLRIEAEVRGEKVLKAWAVMCDLVGVASATAGKALRWMHEQGIIGYFSGKNGTGLRVFLNRAVSSIGVRPAPSGKKILAFPPASFEVPPASPDEAAFKDSFAVSESSDTDKNPRAPKNGADTKTVDDTVSETATRLVHRTHATNRSEGREVEAAARSHVASVDEIVERLRGELGSRVEEAAARAATQTAAREMARTREWFETKALPKAVRVAQHETYDLLRKHGGLDEKARRARAGLEVGRAAPDTQTPPAARELTPEEIRETAETCVALLEVQGKKIDVSLSEISSESGGWLLPEDAPRVREEAERLLRSRSERGLCHGDFSRPSGVIT